MLNIFLWPLNLIGLSFISVPVFFFIVGLGFIGVEVKYFIFFLFEILYRIIDL